MDSDDMTVRKSEVAALLWSATRCRSSCSPAVKHRAASMRAVSVVPGFAWAMEVAIMSEKDVQAEKAGNDVDKDVAGAK